MLDWLNGQLDSLNGEDAVVSLLPNGGVGSINNQTKDILTMTLSIEWNKEKVGSPYNTIYLRTDENGHNPRAGQWGDGAWKEINSKTLSELKISEDKDGIKERGVGLTPQAALAEAWNDPDYQWTLIGNHFIGVNQKDNSKWDVNYQTKGKDFYGQALFVKDNQVVFWVVSEEGNKAKLENWEATQNNNESIKYFAKGDISNMVISQTETGSIRYFNRNSPGTIYYADVGKNKRVFIAEVSYDESGKLIVNMYTARENGPVSFQYPENGKNIDMQTIVNEQGLISISDFHVVDNNFTVSGMDRSGAKIELGIRLGTYTGAS
jgi:hypothetical protein